MDPGHQRATSPPCTENGGPEKGIDLIKVTQLQENLETFGGTESFLFDF